MDAVWSTGLCTMAFENRDRYTVISGLAVQGLGFRDLQYWPVLRPTAGLESETM